MFFFSVMNDNQSQLCSGVTIGKDLASIDLGAGHCRVQQSAGSEPVPAGVIDGYRNSGYWSILGR
jgi:hypothetical protein